MDGKILNNIQLLINPAGLVRKEKNIKAGITYFGFRTKDNDPYDTTSCCDVILNSDSLKEVQDKIPNPLFSIFYDLDQNEYFFKYCKKKQENFYPSILLLGMKKSLILRNTETVTIGNVILELKLEKNKLIITKFEITKGQTKEIFSFDSDTTKEVTIGRDKKCTIVIDNSSLSRVNATIKYFKVPIKELLNSQASNKKRLYDKLIDADKDNRAMIKYWELYDGTTTKSSTNGVWLFSNHTYPIYDGFTVRLGKSKFIINKQQAFD